MSTVGFVPASSSPSWVPQERASQHSWTYSPGTGKQISSKQEERKGIGFFVVFFLNIYFHGKALHVLFLSQNHVSLKDMRETLLVHMWWSVPLLQDKRCVGGRDGEQQTTEPGPIQANVLLYSTRRQTSRPSHGTREYGSRRTAEASESNTKEWASTNREFHLLVMVLFKMTRSHHFKRLISCADWRNPEHVRPPWARLNENRKIIRRTKETTVHRFRADQQPTPYVPGWAYHVSINTYAHSDSQSCKRS